MTGIAIVGAQWGDEGKGKVTDYYAEKCDLIVRSAGGPNAGHTIYDKNGNKFVFHIMPSGALYGDKKNLVGNGLVVDPVVLCEEIKSIEEKGYKTDLVIDECAHIIMPWHKLLDGAEEASRSRKIGTTKRGIGPTYMTKAERTTAIRFMDFADEARLSRKLDELIPVFKKKLNSAGMEDPLEKERIIAEFRPLIKKLAPYKGNVSLELNRALDEGRTVLFEGAQGTLLDLDHGTFPFVTSSNSTIGGCLTGTGVGPARIDKIIGVAKAYVTRVGEGPFPTELKDDLGKKIQEKGQEFGATTGRPRRCGWPDMVLLKYTARVNGITGWAITKLDILDGLDPVKVCTAYEIDGKKTDVFPRDITLLERAKPTFTELKGWGNPDWTCVRKMGDMPRQAQDFLRFIEKQSGVPVALVSFGPRREQTIEVV